MLPRMIKRCDYVSNVLNVVHSYCLWGKQVKSEDGGKVCSMLNKHNFQLSQVNIGIFTDIATLLERTNIFLAWGFELKFEVQIWGFKLKLEIWNWNLKLQFGVGMCH